MVVFAYPTCLLLSSETNTLSTTPNNNCFKALSQASYFWNSFVWDSCLVWIATSWDFVAPGGKCGVAPRLVARVEMKGIADSRLYTAGVNVRYINSRGPSSKWK